MLLGRQQRVQAAAAPLKLVHQRPFRQVQPAQRRDLQGITSAVDPAVVLHQSDMLTRDTPASGRPFAGSVRDNVRERVRPQLRPGQRTAVSDGLKEVLTSLALTEAIYRVVKDGSKAASTYLEGLMAELGVAQPAGAPLAIWYSSQDGGQRYCHVETEGALYVGIMGSLTLYDWRANFNVLLTDIWQPDTAAQGRPAAHRGYLRRSIHVPVEALYARARARGKRLIMCGHSLGGAVAQLCALRLLQQLPPDEAANVSVLAFASPPVGNQALARAVQQAGWQDCFATFLMPEDYVPRLMTPFRRVVLPNAPSLAAVAALQHRSQPRVSSNIQPFRRPASWRRQAQQRQQRQQRQPSDAGVPAAAEVAATQEQPAAPAQRWSQLLFSGLLAIAAAAGRLAASPLRLVRTYQPFGHEVYLVLPVHGHGLHAAIQEGMQRSLLCPTAHRMPSHRARILDIIHASAASDLHASCHSATRSSGDKGRLHVAVAAAMAFCWSLVRHLTTAAESSSRQMRPSAPARVTDTHLPQTNHLRPWTGKGSRCRGSVTGSRIVL